MDPFEISKLESLNYFNLGSTGCECQILVICQCMKFSAVLGSSIFVESIGFKKYIF